MNTTVARLFTLAGLVGIVWLASIFAQSDERPRKLVQIAELTDQQRLGKTYYERYCSGCHGLQGDGMGPAADRLEIPPRDFRIGVVRFASVEVGSLPRLDDLKRTIRNGLAGTPMPAWRELGESEIDAIAQYLRSFSPRWQSGEPEGRPVPLFSDPFQAKDPKKAEQLAKRAIEQGRKIYHGMAKCVECHPSYHRTAEEWTFLTWASDPKKGSEMRAHPHLSATDKTDEYSGNPLTPPDFKVGPIKSGGDLDSLARTIGAGVGGARMPSWAETFRLGGAKWFERLDGSKLDMARELEEDFAAFDAEEDPSAYWGFVDDVGFEFEASAARKFWALVYYVHALVPEKFGGAWEKWGQYAEPPLDSYRNSDSWGN